MKQIIEKEKIRGGTWFYPLVVVWMKAYLNVNLQSILKKGRGLNKITGEVLAFKRESCHFKIEVKCKTKINMHVHNNIKLHLKTDRVYFQLMQQNISILIKLTCS